MNWSWLFCEAPSGCHLEALCETATVAYIEFVSKAETELGAQGSSLNPKTTLYQNYHLQISKDTVVLPHWIFTENSTANILRMLARWHLSLLCTVKYSRNWHVEISNIFLSLSSTLNFTPVLPLKISERQINGSLLVIVFYKFKAKKKRKSSQKTYSGDLKNDPSSFSSLSECT